MTREIYWTSPDPRGILPLDGFHVPVRLNRTIKTFHVTCDRNFEGVIDGCADRALTWITPEIRELYVELHKQGHAHSVEAWKDGKLAGGVYGVAIGSAFMAESMFHRARDAGKVALVCLVRHLIRRGYGLCDIQMVTPATLKFGAIEIRRTVYLRRLKALVHVPLEWGTFGVE